MEAASSKLIEKTYAVIDGDTFDYLIDVSRKHNCEAGTLLGIYVAAQLDTWKPHFKKSMAYFFGKSSEKALDALHLEGRKLPCDKHSEASAGAVLENEDKDRAAFLTPVDKLAQAWEGAGGDQVAGITKRRLHSQTAAKYTDGTVKMPRVAARIYRSLFPDGTFQTFVTDCFRYPSSIDQASVVLGGSELSSGTFERWKTIWKVAAGANPAVRAAGDPYLFLCCALNPLFDCPAFSKNIETYTLWDAITVSTSRRAKKQPNPAALMKGATE
jgi:hypothetical protein